MDRRHLVRAHDIRHGSELDEHLHDLDVAVPGGVMQGGVFLLVQLVNVLAGVLAVADVGLKLLEMAISCNLCKYSIFANALESERDYSKLPDVRC